MDLSVVGMEILTVSMKRGEPYKNKFMVWCSSAALTGLGHSKCLSFSLPVMCG